ncbi:hypothetical protein SDC9_156361 [bioreactor metagenome]|uniref:Uncharacterized protein n=1 Tax=bioreactor metagenome TaxID=1076179 RepID=A0A645F9D0_9ZZZZ
MGQYRKGHGLFLQGGFSFAASRECAPRDKHFFLRLAFLRYSRYRFGGHDRPYLAALFKRVDMVQLRAAAGDEFQRADEAAFAGSAFAGDDDEVAPEVEGGLPDAAYSVDLKLFYQVQSPPSLIPLNPQRSFSLSRS